VESRIGEQSHDGCKWRPSPGLDAGALGVGRCSSVRCYGFSTRGVERGGAIIHGYCVAGYGASVAGTHRRYVSSNGVTAKGEARFLDDEAERIKDADGKPGHRLTEEGIRQGWSSRMAGGGSYNDRVCMACCAAGYTGKAICGAMPQSPSMGHWRCSFWACSYVAEGRPRRMV